MGEFWQAMQALTFGGAMQPASDKITPAECDKLSGLLTEGPVTKAKTNVTFEATATACQDLYGEYVHVCEEEQLYKEQRPLAEATWERMSHRLTTAGTVTQAIEAVLTDGLPIDKVDRFRDSSRPAEKNADKGGSAGAGGSTMTIPSHAIAKRDALCPDFFGPNAFCAKMSSGCKYKHGFDARMRMAERVMDKARSGKGGGRRADRDDRDRDGDRDRDRDKREDRDRDRDGGRGRGDRR
jgi:hypothetical protein